MNLVKLLLVSIWWFLFMVMCIWFCSFRNFIFKDCICFKLFVFILFLFFKYFCVILLMILCRFFFIFKIIFFFFLVFGYYDFMCCFNIGYDCVVKW